MSETESILAQPACVMPDREKDVPLELSAEIWARSRFDRIERSEEGLRFQYPFAPPIDVRRNRISFVFAAGDRPHAEGLRSVMQHAKTYWGGSVRVEGSEDFKIWAWAAAKAEGVRVTNYEPPYERGPEAAGAYNTLREMNRTGDLMLGPSAWSRKGGNKAFEPS